MSKQNTERNSRGEGPAQKSKKEIRKNESLLKDKGRSDYLFSMSHAPSIDQGVHWFQLLPVMFFTAVVILMVRMTPYERPMAQFFWNGGGDNLTDFFSYIKMIAVLVVTGLAILILLYRVFTQSFFVKPTIIYIPMAIYLVMVGFSYLLSDYKEFSLLGWNDRFEGTLTLIAYMVMLFYIINTINTERAIKWVLYVLSGSSILLSLLGITQALDKDFFRTVIGQKLITPNVMTDSGLTMWQLVDQAAEKGEQALNFTFVNRQIYQTVYNINYVSFYLTLLLPLFGLLFIRSVLQKSDEPLYKKILWGALFALTLFNLIGSASSGGFLGMGVVVLLAIVILNKRILQWWKPMLVLVVITVLIGGITYERWMPELTGAVKGAVGSNTVTEEATTQKSRVDYIVTHVEENIVEVSIEGEVFMMKTYPEDWPSISILDSNEQPIRLAETDVSPIYRFDDQRFSMCKIQPAKDDQENEYFVLTIDEKDWLFAVTENGTLYRNDLGKLMPLRNVESIGWEDNLSFGSGRGYIWSRTLPMMKDTALIGHGADTYCVYFPHDDYVGKYNAGWNINMIVDKPHNMYMGIWVNTGGISLLAFLGIVAIYFYQSIRLYFGRRDDSWLFYAGVGMFLGIVGFASSGIVNDSTVSVMPMFYGLLGMGISTNMILQRTLKAKS